ncbi:MAG: glycosyltransferase family 52 [Haemophilus parainfluenzae]
MYYKIKLFNKKFDKIFVANIENILIQSIISSLKFNELITFDDGTANILKNSMLYQNNESWKLKFIKFIFMIDHDINTLKDISSLHYTIYDMDNIIKIQKEFLYLI